MNRSDLVMAAMSAGGPKASFDSLGIQKLLFLIDAEIPDLVEGPHFAFEAYRYGPFDAAVYRVLGDLTPRGHVRQEEREGYTRYALTGEGYRVGSRIAGALSAEARDFMERAARWLLLSTFRRIVTTIYRRYPEMAQKSVVPELAAASPWAAHRLVLPDFLSGVARLFDFTGTMNPPLYEGSPEEADARGLREDWQAVGDDMERALAALGPPEPAR